MGTTFNSNHHLYAMVALDIDGTLTGPDGTISSANRQAVDRLRQAGMTVVLASGRSHANMLPFHQQLELDTPLVSVHGVVVRDPAGASIRAPRGLCDSIVEELTLAGREFGVSVLYYRNEGVFLDRPSPRTRFDQERSLDPQKLVEDLLALPLRDVHKVMWLGEPEQIARLAEIASERFSTLTDVIPTDPGYLEFIPRGASKADGLATLVKAMGLEASRVAAFGDGNNDVPMLAWAGMGVAMPHGSPAARAAARMIGPEGAHEDALARALALVFP